MSHEASTDMTAATVTAPFARSAVISADHLCGQGIARLVERSVPACQVDVLDSPWSMDRTVNYGLVVLRVTVLDGDVEFAIAHLRTWRDPPVIALVVPAEVTGKLVDFIACGADLVLSGQETPQALQVALTGVAVGFCVVSAPVARTVPSISPTAATDSMVNHSSPAELARLTARQREIVGLVAEGLSNKRIAVRLGIGEGTVKVHLTAVFRNLAAKSRTELACRLLRSAASAAE